MEALIFGILRYLFRVLDRVIYGEAQVFTEKASNGARKLSYSSSQLETPTLTSA